MSISKNTLKGYILEEVLAYLIRNTGYRLIVNSSEDQEDLTRVGAGLAVKGRGAIHQVDVLGQLKWIPAFTFPLRLFVEAKFRGQRTGLQTVRNAVGVILDINQKNLPSLGRNPVQKYHYAYSLFSMSGFSQQAQDMALAHQISLIDLSGLEYQPLADTIDQVAEKIQISANRNRLVYNLRYAIREELETMPQNRYNHESPYDSNLVLELKTILKPAIDSARDYGELFVGMANGPFMLLLKADNPDRFISYVKTKPKQNVTITWSAQHEHGRVWTIRPVEERRAFELKFRLPKVLEQWVFGNIEGIPTRALGAKTTYLSNITIYYHSDDADRLFTLEYDRNATELSLRQNRN